MCQQPGAAFTSSAAWLNTFPLLSHSEVRQPLSEKPRGFAPDAKLCDTWRGEGRDKRKVEEKKAAETHAPLFSPLSTNLSPCIRLGIHHTFPTPHPLFRPRLRSGGKANCLDKILLSFSFWKKPDVKNSDNRLSNKTETKNNYFKGTI